MGQVVSMRKARVGEEAGSRMESEGGDGGGCVMCPAGGEM